MERKIGEIFEYNGEWFQCVEGNCAYCSLKNETYENCEQRIINDVCKLNRIFKKLERLGEPYKFDGHIFQAYRTFEVPIFIENYATVRELGNNSKISIEIKQNKEDMEERELDPHMAKVIDEATQKIGEEIGRQIEANINKQRMKPFNLEAAKAGKPVCTRDGRKARIICFDAKGEQPIIALFEKERADEEIIQTYNVDGSYYKFKKDHRDLMMLPEKKEGWVMCIAIVMERT